MYSLIIVDDEVKIREGLMNLFPWDKIGFEIKGNFSNASDALAYIADNRIDVVLTDIKMPGMTGIDLSKAVMKQRPDTIVVFLTGYSDFNYMREAILHNVADYLLKPIKYEELYTAFDRISQKLDAKNNTNDNNVNVTSNYYSKIISEVCTYLNANYQHASLEEAASIVRLSPNYLSKLFREKAKIGFSDYLQSIRMKKAAELLSDIQYKHYEIAYMVGYDNPKNFSRAFKQYFKISPREFRENNQS